MEISEECKIKIQIQLANGIERGALMDFETIGSEHE